MENEPKVAWSRVRHYRANMFYEKVFKSIEMNIITGRNEVGPR